MTFVYKFAIIIDEYKSSIKMKDQNDAAKTATPLEPVTEGQIGKLNQNTTARLLKHKDEIPSDVFQQILGDKTLIDEIHSAVRRRVQAITNVFVVSMGTVKPAGPTTVDDTVKNGNYTGHYSYLKNKVNAKIFENWPKDLPEKEIFLGLVPKGETIPKGGAKQYWAERGYDVMSEYADAYLHQLMCDIPEDRMPAELKDKYIVAYTDKPSFRVVDGDACRLWVYRNDADRELSLVFENDGWSDRWAFVLCKKPSATEA